MLRRTVVKGAMWSAPVIAVGTAAPAGAVSPLPPGLQGWVTVGKNCNTFGNDTLTINGTGGNGAEPPNTGTRGIWIYITTSSTTLANARMTFYYPNSVAPSTWSAASGNSGWSVPVVSTVDPTIAGFTAIRPATQVGGSSGISRGPPMTTPGPRGGPTSRHPR